jgi:hypothetical protein
MQKKEKTSFISIKNCTTNSSAVGTLRAFSMAQIVVYFIETKAADNQPTRDFKSLRESSFQMLKKGHIQELEVQSGYNTLIVKCKCLPEMIVCMPYL